MTLVRFDDLSLRFGDQPILTDAAFSLEPGERVCVIGRNGSGKTTLLRLITGELQADTGEIHLRAGLRTSLLAQTLPDETGITVREAVASGLAEAGRLVEDYQRGAAAALSGAALVELEALHRKIDALDGWRLDTRVDTMLTELGLPGDERLGALSGGWRRRVALARALVSNPELLMLDEPTNHLDLSSIRWLEERVAGWPGAVMFITHDRAFLQRLATRIVEIDRGRLVSWPGEYRDYLRRKAEAIAAEQRGNSEFDRKLAVEEAWIREGIKARRTRNEGRVRALEALREERAQRVARPRDPRITIGEAENSGRKVIEARNLVYGFGDVRLIDGLSLKIMRGERIGLVGNNGVGKSTLLRLLLGEIEPWSGSVKHGTGLEVGYFDQMRRVLEDERSVADNVAEGRDHVTVNGRSQHIVGYLRGFLFSAKRALTPVSALSGGERNRVILAKLFTRPTNLLVLDEPTNDLDIETLEVLESQLEQYTGTLIVVSHDRAFLDKTVSKVLVFEAGNRIVEYAGGFSDWLARGRELAEMDQPAASRAQAPAPPAPRPARRPTKLGYKDQRELDRLPGRIEALEAEIAVLNAHMADPDFYAQPWERTQPVLDALSAHNAALDVLTERWLELEALREALGSRPTHDGDNDAGTAQ